jgi:6-phosphogluconolactonase
MDRRSFIVGLSLAFTSARWSFGAVMPPGLLFVGTTTRGKSSSKGIYSYRWDSRLGTLTSLGLAAESESPAFLSISPDARHLYAANEISDFAGGHDGSASAFSLDRASGKLTPKNVVSSGGAGPCNIAVDHSGRVVFVADGAGGSLASYRILADGSLSEPVSNFHFPGHSVNPVRQKTAYTHCTTVSPDNRYLVVNDLGLDRITTYRFDPSTAILTQNGSDFYQAIPGSGPRGFIFHPNRRWAYSVNEILSTVDALAWDQKQGTLTRLQNLPTAPSEFTGTNMPATARVERTGRFLYISNRGANTIGVFSIDQNRGTLEQIQQIPCGGSTPRHFTIDPTEHWLLVGNQASANITILKRDAQTGLLTSTKNQYELASPMCLIFA